MQPLGGGVLHPTAPAPDMMPAKRRDPAAAETELRAKCSALGISIRQRGRAWLLQGAGVSLLVASLRDVDLKRDLKPHDQFEAPRRRGHKR